MAFDPVSAALDIGGKLIDRLWPDPAQQSQAKLELLKMHQTGELQQLAADTDLAKAQAAIDQAEAQSADPFTSRWRPTVGYVCAAAYAYTYVLQPLLQALLTASGGHAVLPKLDISDLTPVLLGMLGLSVSRTVEKVKGVA